MMRNLITALLLHGRITTTEAKAKELRRWVERVVTTAKVDDVASHRKVSSIVYGREAHKRLYSVYRERFLNRPGGYTRIVHCGIRQGDAAPMAIIEFVEA